MIVITNIQLSHWKWITNDNCSFCLQQQETLKHIFFECPKVQELWNQVEQYLSSRYTQATWHLSPTNIILNRITQGGNHCENFICLITKQFIYQQRCLKQQLCFYTLKTRIRNIENMEKYIAIKNARLGTHNRKWNIPSSSSN